MVKVIPAHVENGYVVPDAALPASCQIKSVAILLEVQDTRPPRQGASTFSLLHGILKGYQGDPEADYRRHLEEKYL
jgi:hypothetical protein